MQYWYFQYCEYYNTGNTSIVNITILVIPVSRPAASYYPINPYTRQQVALEPANLQQKCRKMNKLITEYRVKVEHAMGDLKRYNVLGKLWRHQR